MKRNILLIWCLVLALAINACSTGYLPVNSHFNRSSSRLQTFSQPAHRFSYKTNVKAISLKSKIIKITSQQVLFKTSQTRYKVGDILFGRYHNHDLLRRIIKVKRTPSTTTLTTEEATLHDAFEELDVSGFTMDKSAQIPKEIVYEKELMVGKYLKIKTKTIIKPDLSKFQISLKNKTLRVVFNPSIQVESDNFTEFKIVPDMPLHTFNSKLPPMKEVGNVTFKSFHFKGKVGPVPVRLTIRPGASLDLASQARGQFKFQGYVKGYAKAGFVAEASLNAPPFYNLYKDYQLHAKISEPQADLDGAARLKLNIPDIRVLTRIASFNGPYIHFRPFVDGDVEKNSTVKDKSLIVKGHIFSHLGLNLVGGMKATKLFGKRIIPEFRKVIIDKQLKEIYRQNLNKVIPIP